LHKDLHMYTKRCAILWVCARMNANNGYTANILQCTNGLCEVVCWALPPRRGIFINLGQYALLENWNWNGSCVRYCLEIGYLLGIDNNVTKFAKYDWQSWPCIIMGLATGTCYPLSGSLNIISPVASAGPWGPGPLQTCWPPCFYTLYMGGTI